MASPLAHTAIAYAIHITFEKRRSRKRRGPSEANRIGYGYTPTLLQSIFLSNLPDLDALLGILLKDMRRFHNNITHSIFTGLAVSVLASVVRPSSTLHVFLHYILHLLTDLLSRNKRGLMLFAPISKRRYHLPITIFYGFRWGSGIFSANHLWTLATELLFSLLVLQTLKVFRKVSSVK